MKDTIKSNISLNIVPLYDNDCGPEEIDYSKPNDDEEIDF